MNNKEKGLLKAVLGSDFEVAVLVRERVVEDVNEEAKMMLPVGTTYYESADGWHTEDEVTIVPEGQPPYLFSECCCPNCGCDAANMDVVVSETVRTTMVPENDHVWVQSDATVDEFMLEFRSHKTEKITAVHFYCPVCVYYWSSNSIFQKMKDKVKS